MLSSNLTDIICKINNISFRGSDFHSDKRHASHVMLYTQSDPEKDIELEQKLFWRSRFTMQLRFDGTLGFPGGLVDPGENPVTAMTRELVEEHGLCGLDQIIFDEDDYLYTTVKQDLKLVLHFFAKEIPLSLLEKLEKTTLTNGDYGTEVLGILRVPLYCFAGGSSRDQLLSGLVEKGLLSKEVIFESMKEAQLEIAETNYIDSEKI